MIDYTLLESFMNFVKTEIDPRPEDDLFHKMFYNVIDIIFEQKKKIENLESEKISLKNKMIIQQERTKTYVRLLQDQTKQPLFFAEDVKEKEKIKALWNEGDYGEVSGTDAPLSYSCSYCGFKSIDGNKYCGGCGAEMLCSIPEDLR